MTSPQRVRYYYAAPPEPCGCGARDCEHPRSVRRYLLPDAGETLEQLRARMSCFVYPAHVRSQNVRGAPLLPD